MPPGSTRDGAKCDQPQQAIERRSGAVVGSSGAPRVHSDGGVPFTLEREPKRCRRKVIHMNEVVGERWTIAAPEPARASLP